MALIARISTNLARQNFHQVRSLLDSPALIRSVSLNPKPYAVQGEEDYDVFNMRIGRPQSPHLTIYAPQLTTMLSITHRGCGLGLAAYASAIGLGALVLPDSIPSYIDAMHMNAACLYSIKFLMAFPFAFHFCNGIRHLTWDLGKFLSVKEVYQTGYAACASAVILTAVLMLL